MAAGIRKTGKLPCGLTSFVGRPREMAEVIGRLSATRLVTLTGPGGVGKTRLALQIADGRRRAFADGTWLIDLAPLQDGGLLARSVAAALGLREDSTRSPTAMLEEHLEDKHLCLVLDNCEHLLRDCAILAKKLLTAAPRLRILATSRQILNIEGEFVFQVPPLSVPEANHGLTVGRARKYEAVQLFVERAATAAPSFALTSDNCTTVARLCQQLDGIPLAIELAAVQLRSLSVEQILTRLEDRFQLLASKRRAALPRHQTLRAAIDWSHEQCSQEEQVLWARLSVFSGSCDLEAVQEVCTGGEIAEEDMLDLLAKLLDKSILTREESAGVVRYRMLETIRQYGHMRLMEAGQIEATRRSFRDYYIRKSRHLEREWLGRHQKEWIEWVEPEWDNLRVVLHSCMSDPDGAHAGIEIITALWECWTFFGRIGEGRDWLDQALKKENRRDTTRVKALAVNAHLAVMQGDMPAARRALNEGYAVARRLDDIDALAHLWLAQGVAAVTRGDPQEGIPLLEKVLDTYRDDTGTHSRNALLITFMCMFFLALADIFTGDRRTSSYGARCQELAESVGAEWSTTWGMWISGLEQWRNGDMPSGTAMLQESLRRQRALDDRWGSTWNIEVLAWTAASSGQHERAVRLLGIAQSLRKTSGVSLLEMLPFARANEQCEAQLRHALGNEDFAANFRYGMELDFDCAFAYAVGEDVVATASVAASADASPPIPLTAREWQVARLVSNGMSNKEIADVLVIAQRTAEAHVEHILTKLALTSRVGIVAWVADQEPGPR
ncbi:LuxR family transcriptional regulator [Actinoallomurus vinaceus]|uniref:LuxR family transcriptional regulator n=1 Tax=Actinoallomurus vinaceus TaxID=1080074 RepID=A0ABP8UQ70_9ACTN